MINPVQQKIVIFQNADFSVMFGFTNPDNSAVNLTGCRVVAHIRKSQATTGSLLATMDSALSNGSATINTSAGTVKFYLPASITVNLAWSNPAYWDALIVWSDTTVDRFAEGQAMIYPGVSVS